MDEKVREELDNIVSTLVGTGIVSRIYLFGSYACGEETPDSDLDLCVLTPVKDKRPLDLMTEFRRELYGIKTMPLDLFAFNQDEFFNNAKRTTSFHHHIAKNGVLLYECG
jgi:predicted nucleotidyltransferase